MTSAQVTAVQTARPSRIGGQGWRTPPLTPQPDPMPTRPRAPRILTATALALLALPALTGCHDGQGVRDEGPATNKAAAVTLPENQKAARNEPDGL